MVDKGICDHRLTFVRVLLQMPTAVGGGDVSYPSLPSVHAAPPDLTAKAQQPVAQDGVSTLLSWVVPKRGRRA